MSRPIPDPEGPVPCPACNVQAGQPHEIGCDVERCADCGLQSISCPHEVHLRDHPRLPWTGQWPGAVECEEFGWFARINPDGPGWIPCERGEPGSIPDFNRLYGTARWDSERARFVLPDGIDA